MIRIRNVEFQNKAIEIKFNYYQHTEKEDFESILKKFDN